MSIQWELFRIFDLFLETYTWLIILNVVLSWFPQSRYHPLVRWVYSCTEPFLSLFRRWIPSIGGLDFSPLAAMLSLWILRRLVLFLLM